MFITKKNAPKYVYNELRTISSVEEKRIITKITIPREEINVCVIDDEGFNISTLYDLGYKKIRKKMAFEDIDDYKDFDIILCDVEGVGASVDEERQGLAVAEQIKNVYPEKVVLLYSGKNIETFGEMPPNIDGYLRKQSSMSELASSLDTYYKKSIDPVNVWEKTRDLMIKNKVSTKTIAFLEDKYCRSLLEGGEYIFNLSETTSDFSIPENILQYVDALAKVVITIGGLMENV